VTLLSQDHCKSSILHNNQVHPLSWCICFGLGTMHNTQYIIYPFSIRPDICLEDQGKPSKVFNTWNFSLRKQLRPLPTNEIGYTNGQGIPLQFAVMALPFISRRSPVICQHGCVACSPATSCGRRPGGAEARWKCGRCGCRSGGGIERN